MYNYHVVVTELAMPVFTDVMNSYLSEPLRRNEPCYVEFSLVNNSKVVCGFLIFICKPEDHITETCFEYDFSVGRNDVEDAFSNLGIEQQLNQLISAINYPLNYELRISVWKVQGGENRPKVTDARPLKLEWFEEH